MYVCTYAHTYGENEKCRTFDSSMKFREVLQIRIEEFE